MREILFRAKKVHDKKWIEGGIVVLDPDSEYVFISEPFYSASTLPVREFIYDRTHLVDKETVCQYTGLTDKNGKKIFEGDIVKAPFLCGVKKRDMVGIVEYRKGMFNFKHMEREFGRQLLGYIADIEVIGNVHDNPDLLKEGE